MAKITLVRAGGAYTVLADYTPAMANTVEFSRALRVFASLVARQSQAEVTGWDGDAGKEFPLDPALANSFEYPRA